MINAKVDSVVYEGIDTITAGGKTVELSEVHSGTKTITENGAYDVSGYAEAVVDVPTGGAAPTGTISITANGSYDVSDYAAAQVNVVGAGSISIDTVVMGNLTTKNQAVVLDDTTTKVAPGVFYGARLASIVGNGVTSIGSYSFTESGITSVDFPNAKTVGVSAFNQVNRLTSVNLPLCESLGDMAFRMNRDLSNLSLPSCTMVGSNAFASCGSLASIELPLVATIKQSGFTACGSLTEISLPSLTIMANAAFSGCTKLALVDIGPSLAKIDGNGVFSNCAALATVILRSATRVAKPYGIFTGTSGAIKVYVPSALISEYEAATDWATEVGKYNITFVAIEGSEYE